MANLRNIRSLESDFSSSETPCGLVIGKGVVSGISHVGLMYKGIRSLSQFMVDENEEVFFIHFVSGSVYSSWDESDFSKLLFGLIANSENQKLDLAAVLAQKIVGDATRSRICDFSFLYTGQDVYFDIRTGILRFNKIQHGLSCVTFILTFLQSIDVHLIDLSSWPIDDSKLKEYIDVLADAKVLGGGCLDRVLNELDDSHAMLIKPEDIFAAILFDYERVKYEDILRESDRIRDMM